MTTATQVQIRRGTTAEHATFTGAAGEVTADTTTQSLVVHDGVTPGGKRQATETYVQTQIAALSGGLAANLTLWANFR